jgi:hypothetical protein
MYMAARLLSNIGVRGVIVGATVEMMKGDWTEILSICGSKWR